MAEASESLATDLLRLSEKELTELLEMHRSVLSSIAHTNKRAVKRVRFERFVNVQTLEDNSPSKPFRMHSLDLSLTGIALLHGTFVYPKTRGVVHLPIAAGNTVPLYGTVCYCAMVKGRIHRIGIRFDEPVDLRDFVK